MATVVFLKAANVGGHNRFKPAELVKSMAEFGLVNLGAAGTFIFKKRMSESKVRSELQKRLSFETEMMICDGKELLDCAAKVPDAGAPETKDFRRYFTIMLKPPASVPKLPLARPDNGDWQVKLVRIQDRFVFSLWQRQGPRLLYPNEVVEKEFRIPSTTRNWDTITTICELLSADD